MVADHAVVVIVGRTIVPVFVLFAGLRISRLCGRIRSVVMSAAGVTVRVAVGMPDDRDAMRMVMVVPVQRVHSGVAEQRNAAVYGEQAQANQASETGDH